MSAENGENKDIKQSPSLQEFYQHFGILAENIEASGYTPKTLSDLTVNELQENFNLEKDDAKNIYTKLDKFRSPEKKKQQTKGLTVMVTQLFSPSPSSSKQQRSKSFLSKFEHVNGINFKPEDTFLMDPCSSANGARSAFFQHDFDKNFQKYKNYQNSRKWTPLMYACALRREEIVQTILSGNPDLCVQNEVNQTALMMAACYGHVSILDKLIQYAKQRSKMIGTQTYAQIAGLHLVDDAGFSALHYAVYYAQTDAVLFLLAHGSNCNLPDKDGMTPTLFACTNQIRKRCLPELIKAKGNCELRNKKGQSGNDLLKAFAPVSQPGIEHRYKF